MHSPECTLPCRPSQPAAKRAPKRQKLHDNRGEVFYESGSEKTDQEQTEACLPALPSGMSPFPMDYAKWALNRVDTQVLAACLRRGQIKCASFCTGMFSEKMCFDALEDVWNMSFSEKHGVLWECEHVFICELDPAKRKALLATHTDVRFVFSDARDVAQGRALDFRSNTFVDTYQLEVDLLVAGYPCKDLSGLKNKPPAFSDPASKTGSAQQAILKYVGVANPKAILFENVKNINHKRKADGDEDKPLAQQEKVMKQMGYTCAHLLLNTKNFGLPQSRPREYMWYLANCSGDAQRVLPTVLSLRAKAVALAAVLQRLPPQPQKGLQSKEGTKWKEQVDPIIKKRNLRKADVDQKVGKLLKAGALNARAAHIVAMQVLKLEREGIDVSRELTLIQIDQNPDRSDVCSAKNFKTSPCITPHGAYYIPSEGRLILATEKAALQGVGPHEQQKYLADVCPRLLGNLAGNSFSTTVCMAGLLGLLMNWQRR